MKIIYLHQYFNSPSMPGSTRSYEMARRLVRAGHDVHVVTSWRGEAAKDAHWVETDEAGIHVHWFPVPYSNHMSYSERIRAFVSFAVAARRKAVSLRGDLVFATSTPLTIAIPGVLASRKHGIPMVFEVRDLWPEMPIAVGALKNPAAKWLARRLERWAYRHSSAVVALSPGMKEGVVAAGFPASRVAVIPNSSDNDEFSYSEQAEKSFRNERPWLGERPLITYAGSFGKLNGVGYMVELAKALKAIGSNVRILLVGDGMERPSVEAQAEKAGVLNENLYMEGKIPKREMPGLMSAATMPASLFIDLKEMQRNSANKFFDGLAAGKPVLVNYGGWMHELVESHRCGVSAWRRPVTEVAEELDRKLNDPEWVNETGKRARALAEGAFDRDQLADQLRSVLEAAVEDCGDRSESIASGTY